MLTSRSFAQPQNHGYAAVLLQFFCFIAQFILKLPFVNIQYKNYVLPRATNLTTIII